MEPDLCILLFWSEGPVAQGLGLAGDNARQVFPSAHLKDCPVRKSNPGNETAGVSDCSAQDSNWEKKTSNASVQKNPADVLVVWIGQQRPERKPAPKCLICGAGHGKCRRPSIRDLDIH